MNNTKKASAGIFDRNDNHSRLDSRASSAVFSEQSSHLPSRVSSRASNSSHVSSASTIRNSGKFQTRINRLSETNSIEVFIQLSVVIIFFRFDAIQPFVAPFFCSSQSSNQFVVSLSTDFIDDHMRVHVILELSNSSFNSTHFTPSIQLKHVYKMYYTRYNKQYQHYYAEISFFRFNLLKTKNESEHKTTSGYSLYRIDSTIFLAVFGHSQKSSIPTISKAV